MKNTDRFTDANGNTWEAFDDPDDTDIRVIRPVKKTEKQTFAIYFEYVKEQVPVKTLFVETDPTTANKLSEAISAVVERVTTGNHLKSDYITKINEAADAFQESQ